jgi:Ser/Thr protein kinase RdoA (MazF antagonist)
VSAPLRTVLAAFGVAPDAVRLIQHRQNSHWRIRAGGRRYVLRRFGAWSDLKGDIAWELEIVRRLADCGLPVARPLGPPKTVGGDHYLLMPWLGGRRLAPTPTSDADYRRLGALLADFHAATKGLPVPGQRPGWQSLVDAATPVAGGPPRRTLLLAQLARTEPAMAEAFAAAAEAMEARDLPAAFAGAPRIVVHADFQPWNLRLMRGRLSALFDFELTHVDVRAADVALARRGWHDPVVEGYLTRGALSDVEIGALDALWLGSVLHGVWTVLERRLAGASIDEDDLKWNLEQLGKTRPYRPPASAAA